jgi:2-hydroxychromene-2-carboxylate isomerase
MAKFYYDIVCPYAYMTFDFLRRSNVFVSKHIELKPILLGGLFKHLEYQTDPNKTLSLNKASYIRNDIGRQAEYFSIPLSFHTRHPLSTVKAMRLIHAAKSLEEAVSDRLYRAYWQENLDIDNDEVIDAIALEMGIDYSAGLREHAKEQLFKATEEAFLAHVFGVPTIALNNRLYFGGDRLLLIEKDLGLTLPKSVWPVGSQLDFYFDFSSPYSYLGFAEVKQALAAGVKINFIPILLGALFKEICIADIPMLQAHPNKTAYFLQDMKDWANYRGAGFVFNSHFPLRTISPLRCALADHNVIDAIFTAAWQDNLNIGSPEILSTVLTKAGFNAKQILEQAENPDIKEKLKHNTDEAIKRGVFGVPTFFVKGHQVFGQDRFWWIKKTLNQP